MNNILIFPNSKSFGPRPFHPNASPILKANPLAKRKKRPTPSLPNVSNSAQLILLLSEHRNDGAMAALRVQQLLQQQPEIPKDHLTLLEEVSLEMGLYSARNFLKDFRLRSENDSGG